MTKREIEKKKYAIEMAYKNMLLAMEELQFAGLIRSSRDVSHYAQEIQSKAETELQELIDAK